MSGELKQFRTTREDFKLFKSVFMEWANRFGVNDWEISFFWKDVREPGPAYSCISRNVPGRNCSVCFCKTWNMPVTRQDIMRTAIHEVSHLLIADIEHLAESRYVTQNEIDLSREALARKFENAFYPKKH